MHDNSANSDQTRIEQLGTGNADIVAVNNQNFSGEFLVGTSFGATAAIGFVGTTTNSDLQIQTNNNSSIYVKANGIVGVGTTTPGAQLDVNAATGNDPLHARGTPPGSAPNAFIVQNLTSGNAKSQFIFRDSTGANCYSFGNDQAGTGQQNFFIYNEKSTKFPLTIDSSDSVHTLDLVFANGIRATEDGSGLAFKNKSGTKIAVLDDEGNWHIKGKVVSDLT